MFLFWLHKKLILRMPQCHLLGHSSSLFVHNTVHCWLIVNITHSFNPNPRNYANAKEFCETAAKNGFKAGRLFEPKTQSLNDKVYSESIEVFGEKKWAWIGISAKRGSWVYTSSGIELEFQNWDPQNWGLGQANNDAHDCVLMVWYTHYWYDEHCDDKHRFICEFV